MSPIGIAKRRKLLFLALGGLGLNRPAFTMVELLVSMAIFLMALTLFSSSLKQISLIHQKTEETFQDTALMNNQMEEVRQKPFSSLLALNGMKIAEGRGEIFVAKLSDKLLKIKVNLRSKMTGISRQLVSWRCE